MPLFAWFNTTEVDEFARALAIDLTGRLPPTGSEGYKKITPERIRNTREALFARAVAFARTHNVHWYRKAHLGNVFKWELLNAGYEKAFADALTYDLMVVIATKKTKL
jgi:hypothetical protein